MLILLLPFSQHLLLERLGPTQASRNPAVKKGMTTLPLWNLSSWQPSPGPVQSAPRATLSRQGPVFYLGRVWNRPVANFRSHSQMTGCTHYCPFRPASLLLGSPRAESHPKAWRWGFGSGQSWKRGHTATSQGKHQGLLTVSCPV